MKKLLLVFTIVLTTSLAYAQVKTAVPTQSSTNNENVTYRLFPTTNIYNLIKLDTRNGKMWQVQWNTKSENRLIANLSLGSQVAKEDEKNGRFTLQATQNINTFILLDQIDGRVWQVQWSTDSNERYVIPIY
jgi:hypothetical protein